MVSSPGKFMNTNYWDQHNLHELSENGKIIAGHIYTYWVNFTDEKVILDKEKIIFQHDNSN